MKTIKKLGIALLATSMFFGLSFQVSAHNKGKPISKVKDCKALKAKKKAAVCKKCVTKPGKHHYHRAMKRNACHLAKPAKKKAPAKKKK